MKKLLLINIIFLFVCSNVAGQSLEIYGGANRNIFYAFKNNDSRVSAKYLYGLGYNIGIGLDDIFLDSIPLRFTLSLVNYKGIIYSSWYALAGAGSMKAIIDNHKIDFGIFPFNIYMLSKKLAINIGGEFGVLIHEETKGYKSGGMYGYPGSHISLDSGTVEINKELCFGLASRIAYEINISSGWSIVPQFSIYFGLSNEFKNTDVFPVSFRQYFEIGIKRRF